MCNFPVFEAVTNFYFITECSLPSSSALLLVSLSHIGGGSSISVSKTYAAKMFCLYTFKPFSIYLCIWSATVLGNSMNINCSSNAFESRVKFLLGNSYSKKSSSDANSSCELSVSIVSVMSSFSGGLVNFHTWLHIACLIFDQVNTSLNPCSFSILAISRLITLWALLLWRWDFKMLQHLSAFLSNTFPKNCSLWKRYHFPPIIWLSKAKYIANCHQTPWYIFFFLYKVLNAHSVNSMQSLQGVKYTQCE